MRAYTVLGAGAIGLLYGARLAAAGHAVRWVARSGVEQIRHDGIEVVGATEISLADVEVYDDPSKVPPSDVVIVALKTTVNDRLADLVAPAVAPGATVAMFQNGLGVEEQVRSAVPHAGDVLGALCFVCAHRLGPGRVDHLDYGAVTVGRLGDDAGTTGRLLRDDLVAAEVEASTNDDLAAARWRKLIWNIPFNGLSVVLGADTRALLADPASRGLVAAIMDEVVRAAAACGHPVEAGARDEMLAVSDAMTPYAPSMRLDHEAGRPLEIEAIYGAPLRSAAQAGLPMPRVEALAAQLRFIDARSRASGWQG